MSGRTARAALLAAFLGGVVGLAACAAPQEGSGDPGTQAGGPPTTGDIPIGVDIELSGPAAVQGDAYKKALTLVAEQVNEKGVLGGRKIKLVVRDNQSDPTESLQIVKGFIQREKVVGIVGGGSTPTTLSMVSTVEDAGVPTVSMGSSGAIVNPVSSRKHIFKTPADTDQIVEVLLEDMKARGFGKVGFISVDNPYGDAGVEAFTAGAEKAGVEIVAQEKFQATDKDYTTQLTKIIAEQPDAIVCWAIPPGAGIVAKNAKASGFSGQMYFDAGAGAELFLEGAGSTADGVFMVHPTVLVADEAPRNTPNHEQMTAFYDAYTERYGSYSGFASYAADALRLLVAAIEKAGTTDRAQVRDALEQLSYDGITGVYKMSPSDHTGLTTESLSLLTVRGGRWALADSAVNAG